VRAFDVTSARMRCVQSEFARTQVIERSRTTNVFVLFHSPTCSTCAALYASFEQLAEQMSDYDGT
jgi:thioredoxin-like negative regulator of GroEL